MSPKKKSDKYKDLLKGTLSGKPCTALPGIGKAYGARLAAEGYEEAQAILGEYLRVNKNQPLFTRWLKKKCECNKMGATFCVEALRDWSKKYQ